MSVMRFDQFVNSIEWPSNCWEEPRAGAAHFSVPMDASRRGDRFFVHLDLPGVDPDSVELTSEQNVLTVRAERRFVSEEGDQLVVSERPQGTFTRQLFLSDALDTDKIAATYDQGVLTLELPVAKEAKPKRIQISASGRGRK
jgi:HSP20 family protein